MCCGNENVGDCADELMSSRGWRRASACNPSGNCVEVNRTAPKRVGVRDSKWPEVQPITFTPESWAEFVDLFTR